MRDDFSQADLLEAVTEYDRLLGEQAYDDRHGDRVRHFGVASLDAPVADDNDFTLGDVVSIPVYDSIARFGPRVDRAPRALPVEEDAYVERLEVLRKHRAGSWRLPRPGPFRGRLARPRGTGRPRMLKCGAGHDMTPENTRERRVRNRPHPIRECWTCIREARRAKNATPEYRAKHAAYERARRARLRASSDGTATLGGRGCDPQTGGTPGARPRPAARGMGVPELAGGGRA